MAVTITRVVANAKDAVALIAALKALGATNVEARTRGYWLTPTNETMTYSGLGCRIEAFGRTSVVACVGGVPVRVRPDTRESGDYAPRIMVECLFPEYKDMRK